MCPTVCLTRQGDTADDFLKLIFDFHFLFDPNQDVKSPDIVFTNPTPINQRTYHVGPTKVIKNTHLK